MASTAVDATESEFYLFAWIVGDVTCGALAGIRYRSDLVSLNG